MEFDRQIFLSRKIMVAILLLSGIKLALTPHSLFDRGLFLGVIAGFFNSIQLAKRLEKVGELPVNQAVFYTQVGYIIRLVTVILVLLLAFKHQDFFSLTGTAVGILIGPLVAIIGFSFFLIKESFIK